MYEDSMGLEEDEEDDERIKECFGWFLQNGAVVKRDHLGRAAYFGDFFDILNVGQKGWDRSGRCRDWLDWGHGDVVEYVESVSSVRHLERW